MTLPPPSALGRDLRTMHLVTAHYGGRSVSFEGHIEAGGGRFRMAVIDPLGRKALSVDWTDAALQSDVAPFFPEGLQPRNIVADLVLIYWPPAALVAALAPSHAGFEAAADHRSVTHDGRLVIRADFTPAPGPLLPGADPIGSRAQYRNLAFGYSLDIRPLEPAP